MDICINNGYYSYKTKNLTFKSCCTKTLYDLNIKNNKYITYDNETYIVGVGNPNLNMDKTFTEESKILMLYTLANYTSIKENFNLILSCPPISYETQAKQLPMYLRGKYDVIHMGVNKQITINEVFISPETFIVYPINNMDYRYDDSTVFIIDIGGFTTNICKISNGEFTSEDFVTIQNGMWHLDFKISQYLNAQYSSINCSVNDIQILRDKGLFLNGNKDINYMDVEKSNIDFIYQNFCDNIINACIQKQWNINIDTYHKLVTGGGGKILFPYIKEIYFNNATLSNNPIMDNYYGLEYIKKQVFENA